MNRMSRILNLALLPAVAAFGGASTAAALQQVEVFVARQGGYHSLRASVASASLPQTPVPRAQSNTLCPCRLLGSGWPCFTLSWKARPSGSLSSSLACSSLAAFSSSFTGFTA